VVRNGTSAFIVNLLNWQFVDFDRSNQTLTIDGSGFDVGQADVAFGSSRNDIISTGGGNDQIRGGGGADFLDGGSGNDIFDYSANEAVAGESIHGREGDDTILVRGDNVFDRLVLDSVERIQFAGPATLWFSGDYLPSDALVVVGNGNQNRLNVSLTHALTSNLDLLTFQNWTSGADVVTVFGSSSNDNITGSVVDDVLRGLGGRDLISGNSGDDLIRGGDGVDILSGDGGDDHIYGDAGVDILDGGEGNDDLDGNGEADIVDGGTGNDTVEGGTGDDTLLGGSGNDIITGEDGVDRMDGGAGDDLLDGGAGADVMQGGAGNDVYRIDNFFDQPFESGGQGFDTIICTTNFILAAGANIEVLRTPGSATTMSMALTGNSLGQSVFGNAGSNLISGRSGNDTLFGGGGSDVFVFDTPLSASINVDTILDFNPAADTIRLDDLFLTALGSIGTLAPTKFFVGSAAHDADDRIIYNSATGALIYDSNGFAAGGAVQFAKLALGLALTNADFVVV
jgi:Ca2+-binding RTX toxin-like protein